MAVRLEDENIINDNIGTIRLGVMLENQDLVDYDISGIAFVTLVVTGRALNVIRFGARGADEHEAESEEANAEELLEAIHMIFHNDRI